MHDNECNNFHSKTILNDKGSKSDIHKTHFFKLFQILASCRDFSESLEGSGTEMKPITLSLEDSFKELSYS